MRSRRRSSILRHPWVRLLGWVRKRLETYLDHQDADILPSTGADQLVWVQRFFGPNSRMALRTIAAQVNFLRKAGRLEEALILARNGLDRRIRRYGHDDPRSLFAEIQVANVLGRLGHYVEADLHAAHILRVLGDDSTSPIAIDASSWHGVCLVETEQPKEGERFLARAFDGYRRIYGDKHEQTLNTCAYLVRAHSLLGDRDAALAMQRMVVEITAGIHGQDSSQSLHASLQLAVWLHWAGCNDESRRLAEHVALALGADPNDAKRARGLLDELDDTGGSSG